MKHFALTMLVLILAFSTYAQKEVYIPSFITNAGMDLNDPNSQWAYSRSIETDNIVVFWEPGFGENPSTAEGSYRVNMDLLLETAERSYNAFINELGFAVRGTSVTDRYKLMIFLLYTTNWAAYGSGQDNLVGSLHVNPDAARIDHVLAHEIGHCFQYITGCDTQGGYRYGFGPNGQGGNGFWEQCANWKAFEVFQGKKFTDGSFNGYISNNHLHIFHEDPRYDNHFLMDYWSFKRGKTAVARLWRESARPEDPAETYKRIFSVSQAEFNNEIYEHAARLTTWDLPEIRSSGEAYINRRAQPKMNLTDNNYWQIDPSACIQNYGYNSIKLNAPEEETEVTVRFVGKVGADGYRAIQGNQGGWRYGFVALLDDGTRVYSDVGAANMTNGVNPEASLSFVCPANCANLWLVVSGSPQQHWKHPWDDDDSNDEQWPYAVHFENTNLLGVFSNPIEDVTLTYDLIMSPMGDYTPTEVSLNSSRISQAFGMSPDVIAKALGSTIQYNGVEPDGSLNSISTANAPGHWYASTGHTVAWGANAYVYSELNIHNLTVNIGQYPNRSQNGDQYTIRQALVYTKSPAEKAQVTLVFNIEVKDLRTKAAYANSAENQPEDELEVYPNPAVNQITLSKPCVWKLIDAYGRELLNGNGTEVDLSMYASGIYFIQVDQQILKVVKK